MRVLVISVPRSGTRFWMHWLHSVMGVRAEYAHFGIDENPEALIDRADVVIVPTRCKIHVRESWGKEWLFLRNRNQTVHLEDCFAEMDRLREQLLAAGAHFVSTEKCSTSIYQMTMLIADLGLEWTLDAEAFFVEWPKIGSKHSPPNERDARALQRAKDSRAEPVTMPATSNSTEEE